MGIAMTGLVMAIIGTGIAIVYNALPVDVQEAIINKLNRIE